MARRCLWYGTRRRYKQAAGLRAYRELDEVLGLTAQV